MKASTAVVKTIFFCNLIASFKIVKILIVDCDIEGRLKND